MRKGALGCLASFLIAGAVFLIVMMIFVSSALNRVGNVEDLKPGPKIAQLELGGLISSTLPGSFFGSGESMVDTFKKSLKRAVDSDDVKAIVIRVNSPGGEVTASDTIYHAVKLAAEKKPVVVYMDAIAASGGYYIACAADEIIANETTLTGSIGVIIQTLNYAELFGKAGLDSVVFKSGKFKDTLSGGRRMRPDEEEYIQSVVMQMYEKFVGIVSEGREIPVNKLKNGIADGRIFTGIAALEMNLIDATGYIEDAYDRARELAGAPEAKVYKFRQEPSMFDLFFASAKARHAAAGAGGAPRIELDVSDRLLPRLQPGMLYLLPGHFAPSPSAQGN